MRVRLSGVSGVSASDPEWRVEESRVVQPRLLVAVSDAMRVRAGVVGVHLVVLGQHLARMPQRHLCGGDGGDGGIGDESDGDGSGSASGDWSGDGSDGDSDGSGGGVGGGDE